MLLDQELRVRIVEADRRARAGRRRAAAAGRVFTRPGIDPEFLERERIGRARAAIFAMRDDAKNLYAATLAKLHGVGFTIAVVHDPISVEVFERAGIDVVVNPRLVTAEEIVRFAHDPRTQQWRCSRATARGARHHRPERSELVGKPFRELPMTGSLIGAIVRDGDAIFPHGDDVLQAGDRAIVFTEASRVSEVERTLCERLAARRRRR